MNAKPDIYEDELPCRSDILEALRQAVLRTLSKDYDLIALGGHEQAIAHRVAVYLETSFPSFHIDCEYNRTKLKSKTRPAETDEADRKMRPDIVVHVRNTSRNVLAVEMKANANSDSTDDLAKLRALRGNPYLYKGIAFLRIKNAVQDISDGILRARISWYDVKAGQIKERTQEHMNLTSEDNKSAVEKIAQQRMSVIDGRRRMHIVLGA